MRLGGEGIAGYEDENSNLFRSGLKALDLVKISQRSQEAATS